MIPLGVVKHTISWVGGTKLAEIVAIQIKYLYPVVVAVCDQYARGGCCDVSRCVKLVVARTRTAKLVLIDAVQIKYLHPVVAGVCNNYARGVYCDSSGTVKLAVTRTMTANCADKVCHLNQIPVSCGCWCLKPVCAWSLW